MAPARKKLATLALVLLAGGASLLGCASIVGADFDRPEDDATDVGDDGGNGDGDGDDGSTTTGSGDAGHAGDSGKHDASTDASTSPPGAGDDDASGGGTDASSDSSAHLDGGVDGGADAGDSGHTVDCSSKTSPAKGDFVVTEMLIETQDDELDDPGQWIEITNVSGCTLPLAGLQIVSPNSRLSQDDEVDIATTDTTTIPNGGTFVVANVAAPSNIGGVIYSWGGNGTLESGEDYVYIYYKGATISSLEEQLADCTVGETPCYHRGHSMELPTSCAPSDEANTWKESDHMYGTDNGVTAYGTPNAPNSDTTGCTKF
jgi:hypothetical protein